MNETMIILTPEDAQKYKQFCEFYEAFSVLVESGVFKTKGGSIMIHFDGNGVIQNIVRNDMLYRLSTKKGL